MFPYKKAAALGVAAVIGLTALSGCSTQTDWIMKAGDYTIGAGQYLFYLTEQTIAAEQKAGIDTSAATGADTQKSSVEVFTKTIDDKPASDWIKEETIKQAKKMLGVSIEFDNLGLSMTEEETTQIDAQVSQYYPTMSQKFGLGETGINEDSYKAALVGSEKYNKVFEAYYGAEGKEAVPDEDKDAYINEHGASYQTIKVKKQESSSTVAPGEESGGTVSTVPPKDRAQSYLDAINGGQDFNEVYKQSQTDEGTEATNLTDASTNFAFDSEETLAQELHKAIFEDATVDGPSVLTEDDSAYYIVRRVAIDDTARQNQRNAALGTMKEDEFTEKMHKVCDGKGFTQNDSAIGKYDPQAQRDRYNQATQSETAS